MGIDNPFNGLRIVDFNSDNMSRFIIGFICGALSIYIITVLLIKNKPSPPKCTHPTERQTILNYERYEMFLDQMQGVNDKEKIKRLSDSLSKYRIK